MWQCFRVRVFTRSHRTILRLSFASFGTIHEYFEQARDAARIDVYNQNRAARYGNSSYGNNSYGNSSNSNSGNNLGSLAISLGGSSTNAHSGMPREEKSCK